MQLNSDSDSGSSQSSSSDDEVRTSWFYYNKIQSADLLFQESENEDISPGGDGGVTEPTENNETVQV